MWPTGWASIKPSASDADLVLWSDHPLSVYARAEQTIVDGIVYYSIDRDAALRKHIAEERNRLIQKMLAEKKSAAAHHGTPDNSMN